MTTTTTRPCRPGDVVHEATYPLAEGVTATLRATVVAPDTTRIPGNPGVEIHVAIPAKDRKLPAILRSEEEACDELLHADWGDGIYAGTWIRRVTNTVRGEDLAEALREVLAWAEQGLAQMRAVAEQREASWRAAYASIRVSETSGA